MNPVVFLCILGAVAAGPLGPKTINVRFESNGGFGGQRSLIPLVYEYPTKTIVLGEERKIQGEQLHHDVLRTGLLNNVYPVAERTYTPYVHEIPIHRELVPVVHNIGQMAYAPNKYIDGYTGGSKIYHDIHHHHHHVPLYRIDEHHVDIPYSTGYKSHIGQYNNGYVGDYYLTETGLRLGDYHTHGIENLKTQGGLYPITYVPSQHLLNEQVYHGRTGELHY